MVLIVLGSAVLLELAQQLTPDRHGGVQDAIEKIAGGAVGILASLAILYFGRASCAAGGIAKGENDPSDHLN